MTDRYFLAWALKLWGLIFKTIADSEKEWGIVDDSDPEHPVYINGLYPGTFLDIDLYEIISEAESGSNSAWYGMNFHDDGTVEVPDYGTFLCDMDYIRFLLREIERIVSFADEEVSSKEYLKEAFADFEKAGRILRWRVDNDSTMDSLTDSCIDELCSIIGERCIYEPIAMPEDPEGFQGTLNVPSLEGYEIVKGNDKTLNPRDFRTMFRRPNDLWEDIYYDFRVLAPVDSKGYKYAVSYLCLLMVAQSFDSARGDDEPRRLSVPLVFWTEGRKPEYDLADANLPRPTLPGTRAQMYMFERMLGRKTFLDLWKGIDLSDMDESMKIWGSWFEWYPERSGGESVDKTGPCPYWGGYIGEGSKRNIYVQDYESRIDDDLKKLDSDSKRADVLMFYLGFLDAENRYLMVNRDTMLRHPLACLMKARFNNEFQMYSDSMKTLEELYGSDSLDAEDLAESFVEYSRRLLHIRQVKHLYKYRNDSVASVLDSIVLVNLRIASYIRTRLMSLDSMTPDVRPASYGEAGERQEDKLEDKLEAQLEAQLEAKLSRIFAPYCTDDGLFEKSKSLAVRLLFENLIVRPIPCMDLDNCDWGWENYLKKVIKASCSEGYYKDFMSTGEIWHSMKLQIGQHIGEFVDMSLFTSGVLLNEKKGPKYMYKSRTRDKVTNKWLPVPPAGLTPAAVHDGVIDMERRVELVCTMLRMYRDEHLKEKKKQQLIEKSRVEKKSVKSTM